MLLSWFMVMFPLVYSPGPANTLFASNGAAFGFRKTIPFMIGLDIAFALQSLFVGFGLGTVLLQFPALMIGFRYAGMMYILYLGSKFLKAAMAELPESPDCLSFRDGLVVTALNPKAWVMQLMMFSQFIEPGAAWTSSILKLTALLAVLNLTGHVVWILFGSLLISRAAGLLSPRLQNGLSAAMLFASVYCLA